MNESALNISGSVSGPPKVHMFRDTKAYTDTGLEATFVVFVFQNFAPDKALRPSHMQYAAASYDSL